MNRRLRQKGGKLDTSKFNPLSAEERHIIESKGTERPFTGEYDDFYETGTYT